MPELSPYESSLVYAHYVPNFRPNARGHHRGPATDRGGDNPQALAVDLHKGVWFDHVTGEGGDAIAFAMRVLNTDFRGACRAIEAIIGRDILQPQHAWSGPKTWRPNRRQASRLRLFKTGFIWALERYLAELKAPLLEGGDADEGAIRQTTALLAEAHGWNLDRILLELGHQPPALVAQCIEEVLEAQLQLAALIAHARRPQERVA
jgi:hypothetical protein